MKTQTLNISHGWKLTIHESYDAFQGINDSSKYTVTDSEHDSIGVIKIADKSVDFIGSTYNMQPSIDFETKEITIKHKPYEEDQE